MIQPDHHYLKVFLLEAERKRLLVISLKFDGIVAQVTQPVRLRSGGDQINGKNV